MSFVLIISYAVSLLYEFTGIFKLFDSFFERKENPNKLYYGCVVLLEAGAIYFSFFTIMFPNIPLVICMFSISFFLLLNYEGCFINKVLVCLLNYSCTISAEIVGGVLISNISQLPVAQLRMNVTVFILGIILMRIIYYAIVRVLTVFIKRKQIRLKTRIIAAFIIISIIFIMVISILYYIAYQVDDPKVEIVVVFAAAIFILSIYILVIIMDQLYAERVKNERIILLEYQLVSQKEHYEELCNVNIKTRKIYHDLKNVLIAVDGMLKANQYEELKSYISSMNEKRKSREEFINTGVLAIDSILNSKIKNATEQNIKMEHQIQLPEHIHIDIIELSIVIANLLDNGIEAVAKLPAEKRKVKFHLISNETYIAIQTENETENKTFIGIAQTTKLKKEVHGYGLQSVREIVRKYDGNMEIFCENGIFKLQLMLKNNTFDSK